MKHNDIKRYSLKMPQSLFDEVEEQASKSGVQVVDIIRQSLQITLMLLDAQSKGSKIIIDDGETERQIVFTV